MATKRKLSPEGEIVRRRWFPCAVEECPHKVVEMAVFCAEHGPLYRELDTVEYHHASWPPRLRMPVPMISMDLEDKLIEASEERDSAIQPKSHALHRWSKKSSDINKYLRYGIPNTHAIRELVKNLDQDFQSVALTLPFDIVTYRCVRIHPEDDRSRAFNLKTDVDRVLNDPGYKSTTVDPYITDAFCEGEYAVLLIVKIPAETPFVYLYQSEHPDEREILLHRTSQFTLLPSMAAPPSNDKFSILRVRATPPSFGDPPDVHPFTPQELLHYIETSNIKPTESLNGQSHTETLVHMLEEYSWTRNDAVLWSALIRKNPKAGALMIYQEVLSNKPERLEWLLTVCGADPNLLLYHYPLDLVAMKNQTTMARILLSHGANVFNVNPDTRQIASRVAIDRENVDVLRILLDSEKRALPLMPPNNNVVLDLTLKAAALAIYDTRGGGSISGIYHRLMQTIKPMPTKEALKYLGSFMPPSSSLKQKDDTV